MAAIQLNFSLRTSANCKTVHLIGSWDGYKGQFPLNKDPNKSGGWKGTFRFQGSTLKQGQRYWYYYIIDGYHVSHDPARESVLEPTTGRKLNVLDIPTGKTPDTPKDKDKDKGRDKSTHHASGHSRRHSAQVAKGRPLDPAKIQSPVPTKPHATRQVVQEKFVNPTVEALSARLAAASVIDDEDYSDSESDDGSNVPSLTSSRSSNNSSPSSVSSVSSCCSCERYGITRAGDRVKLDCGGSRCDYSSNSDCSSDSEDEAYRVHATRRQGVHVRSK